MTSMNNCSNMPMKLFLCLLSIITVHCVWDQLSHDDAGVIFSIKITDLCWPVLFMSKQWTFHDMDVSVYNLVLML